MVTLKPTLRLPYKTVDGVEIPTDIYIPSLPPTTACPVVIVIHGGAFMLGHAGMNNKDQITDCLQRGWIVLAIEHRLCPGVNILEGPMTDVRDLLAWVQNGGLKEGLEGEESQRAAEADAERVMVMGTSSGGHLALCTAFDTPKPPLAILDFYGAKCFSDPFWSQPLDGMPEHFEKARPPNEIDALYQEKTMFIGGVSLEGQSNANAGQGHRRAGESPNQEARQAFAMHAISTGKVIPIIWPAARNELKRIDPVQNVSRDWPPTAIVHGTADSMIPMRLSKLFEAELKKHGVETEFLEVEGEPHTFCGKMEKGSRTWETQRRGFDFLARVLERSYK